MKGLKINYKRKNTIAAVKDGDLLVVDMHDVRGESFFYAGSVDYDEQLGRVWYSIVTIELGDTFEFEVVETDQMTEPVETKKKDVERPISKLEQFYRLESLIKERGLL